MKRLVLDGAAFNSVDSFYSRVQEVLCPGFAWGRNQNAFNDLLCGGFGVFDVGDEVELVWRNGERSRLILGELCDAMVEIIASHTPIRFTREGT